MRKSFLCAVVLGTFCACTATAGQKERAPAAAIADANRTIVSLLRQNGQYQAMESYKAYVADILRKTSGDQWWNDKNGLFRLRVIERWLLEPLAAAPEAEHLTQKLHHAAAATDLRAIISDTSSLIDMAPPARMPQAALRNLPDAKPGTQRLHIVLDAAAAHLRDVAFKKFTTEQIRSLQTESLRLFVDELGDQRAHRLTEKEAGTALLQSLAQINLSAMRDATLEIISLIEDRRFADTLARLPTGRYGHIIIGTPGDDAYNLDELDPVACIIEPGGSDTYLGGRTTPERPILVIIDLAGDDTYRSEQAVAQGAGHFGISILFDRNGNDLYEASDVAQGSAICGVGILVDQAGNNRYVGRRRVQGSAMFGLGILIDTEGDDVYSGALFAQGYGGPLGIGLLDDVEGNDHYIAGGLYDDPYQEPPGKYRNALSQGCGSGFRGHCNGGLGILLDGAGNDLYETDFFSNGGYWFAAGLSRDFAGNDIRRPLTEGFTRYGLGYACHYGVGLLFDDSGDDQYFGALGVQGFGWDIGTGGLFDFAGNDRYETGHSGQALANQTAWAILYDGKGRDEYILHTTYGQGGPGATDYHPVPESGGNFAFLFDRGQGQNQFTAEVVPNGVTNRSTPHNACYIIVHP